ncbi:Sec-independent protein translocase protein TatB [Roseicyclus marinus]|uniref:Sec-independent protein translocase protein TatB n=1 Tax=Roseicyclus marinus TaxID=2161673 RepID=UPI00240FDE52|nr:Sec-independent protein translocase protein TatB [Roseicyclus marinus]MDG3040746.1 Sec-independent protein translocase protein TatB [Roseicyclus marinus]
MPDIGWMELLVIGIVALIVVGPKDLPMMFRKVGQFTGRVRAMAKDFQRAMDEAADESGMTELNRDLRKATNFASNPRKAGMNAFKDTFGDDLDIDLELDPGKYPEGSQSRKLAEEKAAAAKARKEEAEALRKAKIDQTIADKTAAAKAAVKAPVDAPAPESGTGAAAEPARSGSDPS